MSGTTHLSHDQIAYESWLRRHAEKATAAAAAKAGR